MLDKLVTCQISKEAHVQIKIFIADKETNLYDALSDLVLFAIDAYKYMTKEELVKIRNTIKKRKG